MPRKTLQAREDSAALQKILQTGASAGADGPRDEARPVERVARVFDDVLPTIAEQSKNEFIRANPQMQLGIIAIVDKVAVQMVAGARSSTATLREIWASAFTDEEMQTLIDFYSSDTGKKFAIAMPAMLAVQTSAAQEWGRSVAEELNTKVQEELRAAVAAEQNALQSDIAGPASAPAPAQ